MKYILIISIFCILMSCSHNNEKYFDQELDKCEIGKICKQVGKLTIYIGSKSSLGVLEKKNDCLALALPQSIYKNRQRWNNKNVFVTGKVYEQLFSQALVSYQLVDRFVSVGVCDSNKIIYVHTIKDLFPQTSN